MNLENINEEINYYIYNYPDNAPVLKRIKDKINQVEKQLQDKYSLVFMAEKGAGATTTSEVVICQSDEEESKILITPYEIEEVREILVVFAKSMFSNIHEISGMDEQLAPELIRACRNMTGLTEKKNEAGDKVDLLKELILQYKSKDYNDFEEKIIENAKLEDRKETVFICNDKNEKSWIKKIFRRINLVHIKEASLPKK